jgi:hypothetical protein
MPSPPFHIKLCGNRLACGGFVIQIRSESLAMSQTQPAARNDRAVRRLAAPFALVAGLALSVS